MMTIPPLADPAPAAAPPPAPRARRATGQIMILYALMLPVLLGFVALGIDAAHLFAERRDFQGAGDLPTAGTAIAAARTNATANGFTHGAAATTVAVVTPYNGDNQRIEVTITRSTPTFFARLIGVPTVQIKARAVARSVVGTAYSIFAIRHACPSTETIDWSGSDVTVPGRVHSNSSFKMGGSNNRSTLASTYGCSRDISGSTNTFSGANPTSSSTQPQPITFTTADFPCTYTVPSGDIVSYNAVWQDAGKTRLRPGVYCYNGSLKLSDSNVIGNVTFVATGSSGMVELPGSNYTLTPFTKNVLAYAEGTSSPTLKLNGSGGSWTGYLYAANGQAEVSGSGNFSLAGSIVARTVKLNGSSWSITNMALANQRRRLVE